MSQPQTPRPALLADVFPGRTDAAARAPRGNRARETRAWRPPHRALARQGVARPSVAMCFVHSVESSIAATTRSDDGRRRTTTRATLPLRRRRTTLLISRTEQIRWRAAMMTPYLLMHESSSSSTAGAPQIALSVLR